MLLPLYFEPLMTCFILAWRAEMCILRWYFHSIRTTMYGETLSPNDAMLFCCYFLCHFPPLLIKRTHAGAAIISVGRSLFSDAKRKHCPLKPAFCFLPIEKAGDSLQMAYIHPFLSFSSSPDCIVTGETHLWCSVVFWLHQPRLQMPFANSEFRTLPQIYWPSK